MYIVAIVQCLQPYVPATTLRQCSRIVRALLVMTGRITMLDMSRWAGQSGRQETQSAVRKASAWTSEGPQEQAQSRWDLHAGVTAYCRLARRLAALDCRGDPVN